MGVRGLQFYVENHCPDACRTVSIEQMAVGHARRYRGAQPTIVVDGMSLLNRLYAKTLEWIYGGQWVQFCVILEDFVRRFRQIGVRLVLFFDGTVMPSKRHEWIARRLRKIRDIESLFDSIRMDNEDPQAETFLLPASMGTLTRFVFKCCIGAEVYSTTLEADLEIAEYANNHEEVFAILGQDTDFIIFDSKPYLSATHLDLERMTTVHYDRHALAIRLSLSVSKLPLFSCIMGNDIVPVELVKPFHRLLCQKAGERNTSIVVLAPLVSSLINSNRWSGDVRNEQEMMSVASIAFGDCRNSRLLRSGLESYQLASNVPKKPANIVEEKHISCDVVPTLYNVIQNLEYESSELLEDYRDRSLPPAAEIFKPIRQRLYTILLEERQRSVVKEWCAYSGNGLRAPELVSPQPLVLPVTRCKLVDLWSDSPEFRAAKMQHFFGCLGGTVEPDDLCRIPSRYVVLVCILNYLLTSTPPLLHPWEVVAFLVQAVSLKTSDANSLRALKVPCVEPRAVHLASLFMRGVATIAMLLGTCGYPFSLKDAMPWNFFDGKLFHATYIRATQNAKYEYLCKNQDEVYEVRRLFQVVSYGTSMASPSSYHHRH